MIEIEPHLLAIVAASDAACSILEVMPDVDMVEDLRNLIYIQNDLLYNVLNGKHYGTDNINEFITQVKEIYLNVQRIKEDI